VGISLPFDAFACPRPLLAGGGCEGSRRAVGARGWELVADSARRGREGLIGALVLEFGKLRGVGFAYLRGSKSVAALGFHSDNDNPKFAAILDATGGSQSEKK